MSLHTCSFGGGYKKHLAFIIIFVENLFNSSRFITPPPSSTAGHLTCDGGGWFNARHSTFAENFDGDTTRDTTRGSCWRLPLPKKMHSIGRSNPIPYHPWMVYLPTFTIKINLRKVNISYMDGMGIGLLIGNHAIFSVTMLNFWRHFTS